MRSLLVLCLCVSCAFGQDPAVRNKTASQGHSVFESNRRIRLVPRLITIAQDELVKEGVLPRAAVPDRSLTLANVPENVRVGDREVQLISATSVVERQIPVFVQLLTGDRTQQLLQDVFSKDTRANVRFAPVAVVRDGETAEFKDVSEQPYFVGYLKNRRQIDSIEDGIRVLARPQIRQDSTVHLDLAIRFNKVVSVERIPGAKPDEHVTIPEVHSTEIKLAANVPTGQTVIVGGLTNTRLDSSSARKATWFSKAKSAGVTRQQLLIAFTPEIVEDGQESNSRKQADVQRSDATGTIRGQSPDLAD